MADCTRNATKAAVGQEGLKTAIDEVEKPLLAQAVGHLLAKIREGTVLSRVAVANFETTDLGTAAAGPEVRGSAALMIRRGIRRARAFFLGGRQRGRRTQLWVWLRSPTGLHVSDVETPPMTIADAGRWEYKEVWVSSTRAELNEHSNAGTFSTGEIPEGVNLVMAAWVFSWKSEAD